MTLGLDVHVLNVLVEAPFACMVQVTGIVPHVVHPTLPGEVCASSVVSPSELLSSLVCRPMSTMSCLCSCLLAMLPTWLCVWLWGIKCAAYVCLMQIGMVQRLLQPALLASLVCNYCCRTGGGSFGGSSAASTSGRSAGRVFDNKQEESSWFDADEASPSSSPSTSSWDPRTSLGTDQPQQEPQSAPRSVDRDAPRRGGSQGGSEWERGGATMNRGGRVGV